VRYENFLYLYPPRPEKAVPAMLLDAYERMGWVAQLKMNGTNNVIFVAPDRRIITMNRHAEKHRAWEPSKDGLRMLTRLPGNGWWVFVAELLHSKVPGIRDTNYVHDVLVADGNYLIGRTYPERHATLQDALVGSRKVEDRGHYRVLDERLLLANVHTKGHRALYAGLTRPEEEGIVLKDPKATLLPCGRQSANAPSQHKCRRPHDNYSF